MSLYTNIYIPEYLKQKHRHYRRTFITSILILALVLPTITYLITPSSYAVSGLEWTTNSHFNQGTVSDVLVEGGDITLEADEVTDTFEGGTDFNFGANPQDPSVRINITSSSELVSGETTFNYSTASDPALASDWVRHSFLSDTGLLYISTNAGLSVINTQSTSDTTDDTLVTRYHTGSTPALGSDTSYHSFLSDDGLLYVGTSNGLSVINTQDTTDPGDDTLVFHYHTGSTPPLYFGDVTHSFLTDTGLLYISSSGNGLQVINTQNTIDPGDDTYHHRYSVGTTPAIESYNAYHSFLSEDDLLYISTGGGLSVIDTQGTVDPNDDTLVNRYHTGSTPNLLGDFVSSSFLTDNGFLYLNSFNNTGNGLSVIDTQGTADPNDDTLVTRYYPGSSPSTFHNNTSHSFLSDDGLLYISTSNNGAGLSVVDTQNTTDPSDDILVKRYHTGSSPALLSNNVQHSFLSDDGLLYVSTLIGGLSVLNLNEYNEDSTYVSQPSLITSVPTSTIQYTADTTSDHDVTLEYRTGSSTAVWRDDFNTLNSYAGDLYGWGDEFQDVSVVNGVLTVANPTSNWGAYMWIDPGLGEVFATGSVITARVRANFTDPDLQRYSNYMFFGEWDGNDVVYGIIGDWINLTIIADQTFDTIGFETGLNANTGWNSDFYEIDYIQITTPDAQGLWNAWSPVCEDTTCPINPADLTGNTWIQYRLNLSTTDTSTTPVVTDVTYSNGYYSTGTYTSENKTISKTTQPRLFSANNTVPNGTAITYEYSTNQGTSWNTISDSHKFPKSFTPDNFMWRANLTTTNNSLTPTISSVTLDLDTLGDGQNTQRIPKLVEQLEKEGKTIEADNVRRAYPEYFNPDGSVNVRQMETLISQLKEIVARLETLKVMREGR